jgi:regulator of protease activity HflC (stomatin/prohibitin superfamily)
LRPRVLVTRGRTVLVSRPEAGLAMVFFVLFVVIAAIVAMKAAHVIPEGHVAIVERLGRYHGTLNPGMHFLLPVIDTIRCRYSLEEQTVELTSDAISGANETFRFKARVRYRILDPQMAHYNVADFQESLRNLITTALRHQAAARTRPEIREDTRAVCEAVVRETDALAGQFGLEILGCELEIG